jgi:DNA-binding MarR family transcriptional regulator
MTYAKDMTASTKTGPLNDAALAAGLRISVARLTRRLRSERDPRNELSVGQLSVLGALYRDGACSIGELASQERVQPPSMTRTVNCLEEAGYVVRRAHESDRRQVVIELSARGRATLEADRRRRDAWLAQRLRELTPEERSVLRQAAPILERLAHA